MALDPLVSGYARLHLHASGAWTFIPPGDDGGDPWDDWSGSNVLAVVA